MKPLILTVLLALSATFSRCEGQTITATTNAPTTIQSVIANTNYTPVIGAVADWFKSVKPLLTNDDAVLHLHGDYSTHTRKMGFGGAVLMPINNILYAGFGATHINGSTYYGPFTASIGKEFDLWLVGKTYLFATTGPNLQFGHGSTLGGESSGGFEKAWKINEQWSIGLSGATVNITQESGVILRAGGFLSYAWGKPLK